MLIPPRYPPPPKFNVELMCHFWGANKNNIEYRGREENYILSLFLPVPICFVRDCLKMKTKMKYMCFFRNEKKNQKCTTIKQNGL